MIKPGNYGKWHVHDNGQETLGLWEYGQSCLCVDTEDTREGYKCLLNGPGGHYLITGGGLGICLDMLSEELENGLQITVIEIDKDLVEALQNQYPNVEFICEDASKFIPEKSYDLIFLDHWGRLYDFTKYEVFEQIKRYKPYSVNENVLSWIEPWQP